MKQAAATLGSGNPRLAVMVPECEDLNEWMVINTVDSFHQINMLHQRPVLSSTYILNSFFDYRVTQFYTENSCAIISTGKITSTTGPTDGRSRNQSGFQRPNTLTTSRRGCRTS
ncbi:hypothetical protein HPB48_017047 [Haemaphysalis longicornis]|uniref:Uncharacterized protein n=1 Tax=Haemaphysalis longicornis TaxID=44386 RepID=A0A9J6FPE4_HAELO|nr:hypothetical protein HPB48_017047 [Haemaphysalis longicornis]